MQPQQIRAITHSRCNFCCASSPKFKTYLKWELFHIANWWYFLWTGLDSLSRVKHLALLWGSFFPALFFSNSAAVNGKQKQNLWGDLGLICRRRRMEKCHPSQFSLFFFCGVKYWKGSQVTRTGVPSPPSAVQGINVHLFLLHSFYHLLWQVHKAEHFHTEMLGNLSWSPASSEPLLSTFLCYLCKQLLSYFPHKYGTDKFLPCRPLRLRNTLEMFFS